MSSTATTATTTATATATKTMANAIGGLSLKNVLLYGSLFVTLALLITNIVMLSNAAGSADSWNEIKKQMSSITGTAFTCGIFLTLALYLIVSQYPQMQVTIMSIMMGLAITLSYVAICIAVITR
jgi:hypothetical protein